ncbi:MAG: hypothetical protein JST93_26050 [Acidobacteria bacterium]|nr:hypothetical protein [Acidobacteriota bacterium]
MTKSKFSNLVGVAVLALTIGNAPAAAQSDEDRACSLATLKGTFGLVATGTRPVPGSNQTETHSTLALRSYDGKGGLKSWPIVSQGQVSGVAQGTGAVQNGAYEVNPDCTGQTTLTIVTPNGSVQLNARFVIVNHGLEIIEVPVTPGNVAAARLQRQ